MNTTKNNTLAPSIFIIMGATGDLAQKKILPSLWHLYQHGLLPDKLAVIGFSKDDFNDTKFHELIKSSIKKHSTPEQSEKNLINFLNLFTYHSGTFEDANAFTTLNKKIFDTEASWGVCTNKLFYLAVPPSSYEQIFKNIAFVKLNLPCGDELGWSRILIEKPFGLNLEKAKELQTLLSSYFKEEQIYRIDHYFFKEIIQGVENFRFSNNLFEHTWDKTTIETIHVRLYETLGVEERGSFYDPIGALRDVGQNHILTMLATLTMSYPKDVTVDTIRQNRAEVLNALMPWTKKTLEENTYRAQYSGYQDIDGVQPNSTTETYFALKTQLLSECWKGVPIIMEAGKRLGEARKEIVLTLKHPENCLLCKIGKHGPNKIVFRFEPNDEIIIHFWTKKPGFEKTLEERTFSFFLYEKETKVQYVEEYAKILYAAMEGTQSLFISAQEVMASWKFTDPIEQSWQQGLVPLEQYKPDLLPTPELLKKISSPPTQESTEPSDKNISIIGLGKMGAGLVRQLISKGWDVAGSNADPVATKELELDGMRGAYSLAELVKISQQPRTMWLMVPHTAVDAVLDELVPLLEKGDTIIDGGNSPYKESVRRGKELSKKGIHFLDVGVSGGPGGAQSGACTMVGGDNTVYKKYEHLFKDLSVENGYGYMGPSGAGHFVKMVHNGIEYGMMQAIGEGFDVMKQSPFQPDLHTVASVYNHGSVITSSLVGWLVSAYEKYGEELNKEECCSPTVSHSGEGQWTVDAAKELNIPVEIIEKSLEFRKKSQDNPSYTGRVLSALRHEFGGHDTHINK